MNRYSRSALAGAATGGRSFTALAALVLGPEVLGAPQGTRGASDEIVLERPIKVVAVAIASAEYVVDKLPWVPSRLHPLSLSLRGLDAAAAGYIIANRRSWQVGDDVLPADGGRVAGANARAVLACCGIAGVTALATSWLGAQWRAWAAPRLKGDVAGSLIEDAVVLALAAVVGLSTDGDPGVSRHR
ncbi:MAG TPA: hypothetical protein VHX40_07635 [Acidimicrobiales bacterium]|nr:hypothetical protein [Acidimicrobiales bacterium]